MSGIIPTERIFFLASWLAIIAGVVMIIGGGWATVFTYQTVAREHITTPPDATIPNTPVLGPFTLHSQADAIRKHVLDTTGGRTYAEMSRDEDRSIWITATTLITALHLGIITYLFAGLIILGGLITAWTGWCLARCAAMLHKEDHEDNH